MLFTLLAAAGLAGLTALAAALPAGAAATDSKAAATSKVAPAKTAKPTEKPKAAAKPAAKPTPKVAAKGATTPDARIPLPRARPTRVADASPTGAARATTANPSLASVSAVAAYAPLAPTPAALPATPPPATQANLAVPSATGPNSVIGSTSATSTADLAKIKDAVALARRGKTSEATDVQRTIADPIGRKLVEWAILRSDNNNADFARYVAFITANPSWPAAGLLRRRAEAMLWQERLDPATVLAFFAKEKPTSSKGRFAYARALLARGDRAGAQVQLREPWRNDSFSADLEGQVLEVFKDLLTSADHKARMDMRLYAEDVDGAMRAASRAGGTAPTIAKARAAVIKKAGNAKTLLDAAQTEAPRDIGLIFSRVQWLRRADKAAEAAELVLSLPQDPAQAIDTDQWWVERRLIARKLLDLGDVRSAYRVARDAGIPTKDNYRAEHQFTAGWIALRFLEDPATALGHFARVAEGNSNPITLSRAGYWQGRAAEALGRAQEARTHYEAAARHGTAYYGQLARARIGYKEMALRAPPELTPERRAAIGQLDVVRAAELLYAIGERDFAVGALADFGERSTDISALAAVGEVAARNKDARTTLLIGKAALARGYALEHYAFPTIGIPDYRAIAPEVETSVVYSIARQESIFHQGTVSSAKAMGLMQVTPEAGRETAKKYGATYDGKRLLSDPVYNVQMGAAELADLFEYYRGSYIMTFAGYNAGRGRVREWIGRYGDPRNPKVDPIDWVELIPFSETRNYVQRVMENLQVYRIRFNGGSRLLIEADLRRGAGAE
jgi:soluble lytic murein transglycosylase